MINHRTPQQVLDAELLAIRAKLLELAAAIDRVERAEGAPPAPETMASIRSAIETLLRPGSNRAEQVQLLFSRPFSDNWRQNLKV